MRTFYRCLLWLHPPSFRRQFGDEMLWIFDQAANTQGALAICSDGLASLARQWLLRSGCWKVVAAILLALVQVSLGGVALSRVGPRSMVRLTGDPRPVTLATAAHQAVTVPFVMYLALFVLGGLLLMILGLGLWVKSVSARRRPVVLRVR
jgi:hypothetical protein